MQPVVSVIVPFFNEQATLPLAISSLLAQSFREWEAILVDDGSTDCSFRVARQFDDLRISLLRHPRRMGRGAARATAMSYARGRFIAMLDADDWIYPERLREQVAFLETRLGIDLVSSRLAVIDDRENLLGIFPGSRRLLERELFVEAFPGSLPFPFAASMYRREVFEHFRYDPGFRSSEDYDFFCEAIVGKRVFVQRKALYAYRKPHPVRPDEYREAAFYRRKALQKRLRVFPFRSRRFLAGSRVKETLRRTLYRTFPAFLGLRRGWGQPDSDDQGQFALARRMVLGGLGDGLRPQLGWQPQSSSILSLRRAQAEWGT